MRDTSDAKPFAAINFAYEATFKPGRPTLGLVAPIEAQGNNHVALNLRFNGADIETTLNRLADDLLPDFVDWEPSHVQDHSHNRLD
jgi:hypothetical protein